MALITTRLWTHASGLTGGGERDNWMPKARDPLQVAANHAHHATRRSLPESTILVIPLYAAYVLCKQPTGFSCEAYRTLTKPNAQWGPANDKDRVGRYLNSDFQFKVETVD